MAGTFGKWEDTLKTLKKAPKDFAEVRKRVLYQEAQYLRTKIIQGLHEQAPGGKAFKPLSPQTLAMRKFLGFKGTKALIKRGDLVNAIAVIDAGENVFVGVPRTAKSSTGNSLIDVAEANESGGKPIVIKMTTRMSALLHLAFRQAGIEKKDSHRPVTGIIVVQIPARPFIAPVVEKFAQPKMVERRMADRMGKMMKGQGVWSATGKSS